MLPSARDILQLFFDFRTEPALPPDCLFGVITHVDESLNRGSFDVAVVSRGVEKKTSVTDAKEVGVGEPR